MAKYRTKAFGRLLGQTVDAGLDLLGGFGGSLLDGVEHHAAALGKKVVLLANGIRHPLKARLPIGGLPVAELGRILDLDEGLGRCERLAGRLCTRFELQTGDLLNLSGQIPEKGKTAFQAAS
jgi:hypothetical protein